MPNTIGNVLVGVATLAVHNEHDLAEWTKDYAHAGVYSAHLVKDALSTDRSTHVQFNPTLAELLFSTFQADVIGDDATYHFWERTDGTTASWAQMELRFEEVDGNGWFELTLAPHQGIAWGELAFEQYVVVGEVLCGYGGHTPNGTSVWLWPATDLDEAVAAVGDVASIMYAFEAAETGCGAGVANYVLARVRMELWETGTARECWIDEVTIKGQLYPIEPGGASPGLVLSSPNVEIGYTEDGVTMEYTADEADIEVEEETFPINRVITKETVAITCNMAESSLFNIDKALAGSVLSGNVILLGAGVNKLLNLTLEGLSPAGFKRTIYIPKATATGAVGMSYKKGEKTVVPVTFQALKSTEPACTIVECAA